MKNSKPLLLSLGILVIILSLLHSQEKPMNILVLYADDWRYDTLGIAGNPIVKTPHLDALAKEGVYFTENCVTTSVCGASRANLFTGQWLSRNNSGSFGMFKTPWEETYPGALRENGFYVGHVGKWHNSKFPTDKFDFGRSYKGSHWLKTKDKKNIHVTKKNEIDALDFLKTRPKEKPFCLTVAFFATHAVDRNPDQFLPQPESMKLYQELTIPVPENMSTDSWERLPHFFTSKNEGRNRWSWRFDTPEKYQRMMKNYYRLATEVDTTCGKILNELKKQDLLKNTLVIFTTDNGYYHGEHGLGDKWYPHKESIRVPLIVLDPRLEKSKKGKIQDDFTLSVDLAPTILNAAGLQIPQNMQGEDLAPLYLSETRPEWRQEFFYEHASIKGADFIPASEALVRKDWKYIFWPQHQVEQLFHLTSDPDEEKDVVENPEFSMVLSEMRKRFELLKLKAQEGNLYKNLKGSVKKGKKAKKAKGI